MYEKIIFVLILFVGAMLSAANVRDFGAVGDGHTDDTAAIQRALDAALANADANRFSMAPLLPDQPNKFRISDSGTPEVFFPAGHYRITSSLVGGRIAMLRGEDGAILEQAAPDADLLYFNAGRRIRIENLTFRGGNCQLRLWTSNGDMSILAVENCRFENGQLAFRTDSLALNQDGPQQKVPPYTVQRSDDGQIKLVPRSPENLKWMYNSTVVVFTDTEFRGCRRALWSQVDYTVLENCRIYPAREMAGSVFYFRGLARVNRLTGRAEPLPGKNACWFELDQDRELEIPITAAGGYWSTGSYAFRHLDLDTTGSGMCVVRSNCVPRRSPRSIIVADSTVKSAGCPENGIVYIEKDTHPNLLVVRNVRERSGQPVRAVTWEAEPTLPQLKKLQHYNCPVKENYTIVIGDNSFEVNEDTPAALKPFTEKPVKVEEMPEIPRRAQGKALTASGLVPGLAEDQSAQLQKLVDEAAKKNLQTLLLPGERYRLDRTIELPEKLTIAGSGVVLLYAGKPDLVFFRAAKAGDVAFRNIKFSGGQTVARLEIPSDIPARVDFDFCTFLGQTGTAVILHAGQTNQAALTMRNSLFRCHRGVDTNAARNDLNTLWLHNLPGLDNSGFIVNRGGLMRMTANLGIPTAVSPRKWKGMPVESFGRNIRWVDNYGTLYMQDNRFGGESDGGIPAIFHCASGGDVVIEGGYNSHYNPTTTQSVIHFEAVPKRVIIRELVTHPDAAPGQRKLWSGNSGAEPVVSGVFARY